MKYRIGLLLCVGVLVGAPSASIAAAGAKDQTVRRLEMSEAIEMSEATGRPLLAVAGQET